MRSPHHRKLMELCRIPHFIHWKSVTKIIKTINGGNDNGICCYYSVEWHNPQLFPFVERGAAAATAAALTNGARDRDHC